MLSAMSRGYRNTTQPACHGAADSSSEPRNRQTLSDATKRSSISRLVVSSVNTRSVQGATRSSNQRWSEPSIWISSPTCSRGWPGCWMRLRSARESQSPACRIQPRNVSRDTRTSWRSPSFSAASVDQNPRNTPRPTRWYDHARHQTGGCSMAGHAAGSQSQPHRHCGINNRWVCRRVRRIRSAAAELVSRPPSRRAKTSIRFSSRLLISTKPSPPNLTRRPKTDIPTLLRADILALRLHVTFADPLLWNVDVPLGLKADYFWPNPVFQRFPKDDADFSTRHRGFHSFLRRCTSSDKEGKSSLTGAT
jgi:hypothetical protein